jgi:hypothetical protein
MEISMRDVESAADEPESGQSDDSLAIVAQADAPPSAAPGNAPPETEDMCILTAEDATLSFSVVAKDPDGDPLTVAVSQPQSGSAEAGPDGTVTFVADQPGVQSFQYSVQDGRGGADSADATVFVNPLTEHLIPPAIGRIAPEDVPAVARACATGIALDTTTLSGPEIQLQDPIPGQRFHVQAEPGQRIELQSHDFVDATYLVVDGGLLVITPDGNMAYVAGFVDNAQGDDPLTLSVYEGPAVPADQLLGSLQPIALTTVGQLVPPAAGPEHGGGANFSPYDPGGIGNGPDALGPLAPTALLLGTPPVHFDTGVTGAREGNQPPTLTATPGQGVPVGEVTVTPEFTSGRQSPTLTERQTLDPSQIHGVDQGNFTLGPSADASITFIDEVTKFQSSLGVYLIDPDGTIHNPKMVFPRFELADTDPSQPDVGPGVGQLHPGDAVQLSQLYDSSELQPGLKFGLFLIVDGWTLNGEQLSGDPELEFRSSDGQPAKITDPTPQLFLITDDGSVAIEGNTFHSANPTPSDGLNDPLNEGGHIQTTSGLLPDVSGLTASFEDYSDNDFNDAVIQVDLVPTLALRFGYVPTVAPDLNISDSDSGKLSGATVAIVLGQSGVDKLVITESLDGTGITALEDGSAGKVVLEGDASIAVYESILRSISLQAGGTLGERTVSIKVVDDQGAVSDPVKVSYDFSTASLIEGTDGPNPSLDGTTGNDPIAGLAGDDHIAGLAGNDLLDGGEGNDFLDGGPGRDLLFGGPGDDTLVGGEDADQFFQLSLPDRGDQILDFNANEGDVLNLSALFDGQANTANIDEFLQFTQNGDDIAVSADIDGSAPGFDSVQVVTLVDPTGVTTVQDAVNSGAVAV